MDTDGDVRPVKRRRISVGDNPPVRSELCIACAGTDDSNYQAQVPRIARSNPEGRCYMKVCNTVPPS